MITSRLLKTTPAQPMIARTIGWIFILAAVCEGCLSRPHLNRQSFTFTAPAIPRATAVSNGRVLAIRTLQIAAPFNGRSLVYRTGEFSYDRDPYAEFLVSPNEALVSLIRSSLRGAGAFSDVMESGGALKANTLLEISVSQLYGDFRQPQHPAAVLAMRFVFLDTPHGVPEKVIFEQDYSRSILLRGRTAAALMEGWNEALYQVLAEVISDFDHSKIGTAGL